MRNRSILLIGTVMMIIVLLIATFALAADPAPAPVTIGSSLYGLYTGTIVPYITAFFVGLLGIVLDKVRVKTGLQISAERQAQLVKLAEQGIGIAEEKAAAYFKANASKLSGTSKLDIAIAHLIAMAPKVSPEQADGLVHYVLAKSTGAGATGSTAV